MKLYRCLRLGTSHLQAGFRKELRYLQSGKSPHVLILRKDFIRALKDYLHSMQIEAAITTAVTCCDWAAKDGWYTPRSVNCCWCRSVRHRVIPCRRIVRCQSFGYPWQRPCDIVERDFALLRRLNRKPYWWKSEESSTTLPLPRTLSQCHIRR